jgi:hypothetical protein
MQNFWAGSRGGVKALPLVFAKGALLGFHTSHKGRARTAAVLAGRHGTIGCRGDFIDWFSHSIWWTRLVFHTSHKRRARAATVIAGRHGTMRWCWDVSHLHSQCLSSGILRLAAAEDRGCTEDTNTGSATVESPRKFTYGGQFAGCQLLLYGCLPRSLTLCNCLWKT